MYVPIVTEVPIASYSAQLVDIATNSAIAQGLHDIAFILWVGFGLVLFYVGFRISVWIFKW